MSDWRFILFPPDPAGTITTPPRTWTELLCIQQPNIVWADIIAQYGPPWKVVNGPNITNPDPVIEADVDGEPITLTDEGDYYSAEIQDTNGQEVDLTFTLFEDDEVFKKVTYTFSTPRADGYIGRQYVYASGDGNEIRKLDLFGNLISTIETTSTPYKITSGQDGEIYFIGGDEWGSIYKLINDVETLILDGGFYAFDVDVDGNIFVANADESINTIIKYSPEGSILATFTPASMLPVCEEFLIWDVKIDNNLNIYGVASGLKDNANTSWIFRSGSWIHDMAEEVYLVTSIGIDRRLGNIYVPRLSGVTETWNIFNLNKYSFSGGLIWSKYIFGGESNYFNFISTDRLGISYIIYRDDTEGHIIQVNDSGDILFDKNLLTLDEYYYGNPKGAIDKNRIFYGTSYDA